MTTMMIGCDALQLQLPRFVSWLVVHTLKQDAMINNVG
jgi:hypothetical protein